MEGPATLNIGQPQTCGGTRHTKYRPLSDLWMVHHTKQWPLSDMWMVHHTKQWPLSDLWMVHHTKQWPLSDLWRDHHTKYWPLHFSPSKSKVYLNVVRGCQQYTVLANRPGEKRMEKDYRMNTVADFTKERQTRITIINLYELS